MHGRAGEWAPGWGRGGTCLGRWLGGGGPGLPGGLVRGLTVLFILQILGSGAGPPHSSYSPQKKLSKSNSSARIGGQGCAHPCLGEGRLSFLSSPFTSQSSQSSLGTGRGVGVGGSIFHVVWRPPSHTVSPPLAPVTWAGSPPSAACHLPLHPPGSSSGEGGRALWALLPHTHTPPAPMMEGRGGRRGVRVLQLRAKPWSARQASRDPISGGYSSF